MILNNLNDDGCGSLKKCQSCTLNLVCYKSPLCKIKNIGESQDDTNKDIINYIQYLSNDIRVLNLSLQDVIKQQNTILDIMCKWEDVRSSTVADVDVSDKNNQEDEFALQLIDNSIDKDDDKVFVEKRTLFGKKKWVQQKE